MKFVAIDVETANADMASICQIGIARCEGGVITDEWTSYVDPEDYFDGVNVSIHGIDGTFRYCLCFVALVCAFFGLLQPVSYGFILSHARYFG